MKRKGSALESFRRKTRRLPPDVCRQINSFIFLNHPDTIFYRRQYRQSLLQNAPAAPFHCALGAEDDELDAIRCIACGDICYLELHLVKIGTYIKDMVHESHLDSLLSDDSCEHYTLPHKILQWIANYRPGYHDLCHSCSESPEWIHYMEHGQCSQCYPD